MKKITALVAGLMAFQVNAAVVTYDLFDIGTFTDYTNLDTSATYSGDGFLGMYDYAWAHLFGVEDSAYSRTVAQVNIAGLAGKTVTGATLGFSLLDGSAGSQNVTFTGFNGGSGNLAYNWDAPSTNFGSVVASVNGGANLIDIKALLEESVGAGDTWFGLHLQGSSLYQWTYTGPGYSVDRALAFITVEFEDGQNNVPEPASLALVGLAAVGLGLMRRRKTNTAA
jgi:hypothetical protein